MADSGSTTSASEWHLSRQGCVLCGEGEVAPIAVDRARSYWHCASCDLIFVPRDRLLSIDQERARYALHNNRADDAAYVAYVDGCIRELERIPLEGTAILDFGCGEHAVLTARLRQRGFDCTAYDPVYGIGPQALLHPYDVIAAMESVEHLREPRFELEGLAALLNPGGHLVIRTLLHPGRTQFSTWWYKNDPTHVNFFSAHTMRWLARALELHLVFCDGRQLVVFRRER